MSPRVHTPQQPGAASLSFCKGRDSTWGANMDIRRGAQQEPLPGLLIEVCTTCKSDILVISALSALPCSLSLSLSLFRAALWHMEVPRRVDAPELQLLAYTTVVATPDLSCICNLHDSSWQCCWGNLIFSTPDRWFSNCVPWNPASRVPQKFLLGFHF